MSSIQQDPRILYSINNIRAFHIQNGEESELTSSGPQTLSLLMVPTSSPQQDLLQDDGASPPEEDFYLHLHLPPELDMALPATTQIYHQPPASYLIPRWDLGPDAGAFIRLQFPGIGTSPGKASQEDVDTFETILAQCTAFLERAAPPQNHATYNPADYAPGEGYISSEKKGGHPGQIVLIDEEDGSVVGELGKGYDLEEKPGVQAGSKNPVEIQLPQEGEGNKISITNVSEEYLRMSRHPAYKNSTIVQTSATASRLIVTGSSYLANALSSGAENFTQRTKPNPKPVVFTPTTHAHIRKVHTLSQSAAGLSSRTAGQIGRVAQNLGATLARRKETGKKSPQGYDKNGNPVEFKAGVMNKSLIAFSTLMDGIEESARTVLTSGGAAASTMIGHKYGAEAGSVAMNLTSGFKNVGLVYIDASGVSRRAVLKSVAKGMVVGRMHNGEQVVVGGGDGGQAPDKAEYSYYGSNNSSSSLNAPGPSRPGRERGPSREPVNRRPSPSHTPPPAYGAPGTYSLGGVSKP